MTDKTNKQARHPHDTAIFRNNRTGTNGKNANQKPRPKKNKCLQFPAATAVCGAGCLRRCLLVGLIPCYPICHLRPAFVNGSFPATFTLPPLRNPLGTAISECMAILIQCRLILMPPSREDVLLLREPRDTTCPPSYSP